MLKTPWGVLEADFGCHWLCQCRLGVGATQCRIRIGSGFDLISCRIECYGDTLPWESGGSLMAHEKAVPAMMGVATPSPIMEERQMANARKRTRQRRWAKSLIGSMREFLTPEVFKQVRNTSPRRKSPRWDLHPLLYILLLTTYCCGDNLPEKFEAARTFTSRVVPNENAPAGVLPDLRRPSPRFPCRAADSCRSDSSACRSGLQWSLEGRWISFLSAATGRAKLSS